MNEMIPYRAIAPVKERRMQNRDRIRFLDVVRDAEERTRKAEEKHPRFKELYWKSVGLLIVIFCVALAFYGIKSGIDARAQAYAEQQLAAYEAEQEAIAREKQRELQAAQNEEMARRERETMLIAQLMTGLKGFVENYGYTNDDLITYAECPLNRVLNPGFACQTIEEALMQDAQWVGFSTENEVTQQYYKLARWVINDFYTNPLRIVSNDYCWAELNKDGCWLKKEVELNPYSRTWRYESNG